MIGIVGVAPSRRAACPVPPRHLPAISVPISGREICRWRPWRRRRRHLRRPQELRSRRVQRPRRWLVRHRSLAFLRRGRHAVLNQASCPRRHRDPPIPRHPRYVKRPRARVVVGVSAVMSVQDARLCSRRGRGDGFLIPDDGCNQGCRQRQSAAISGRGDGFLIPDDGGNQGCRQRQSAAISGRGDGFLIPDDGGNQGCRQRQSAAISADNSVPDE